MILQQEKKECNKTSKTKTGQRGKKEHVFHKRPYPDDYLRKRGSFGEVHIRVSRLKSM
jgi:hypothetical protein